MQQWAQAIAALKQLTQLQPLNAVYWAMLGQALNRQNLNQEALNAYERALEIRPQWDSAQFNLGNLLRHLGRFEEAEVCYQNALKINPGHLNAKVNSALVDAILGRYSQAIAKLREVLHVDPEHADALADLSGLTLSHGSYDEAYELACRAIRSAPEDERGYGNAGTAAFWQGNLVQAREYLDQAVSINPTDKKLRSIRLFVMTHDPSLSALEIIDQHKQVGKYFPARTSLRKRPTIRDRRIRIGYMSPDLRLHAVARFLEPMLRVHDRQDFEIHAFYLSPVADGMTRQIASLVDKFHESSRDDDDQLADRIKRHDIDVLVDLAGHTANNRISVFAMTPAPLQLQWFGYPADTGLSSFTFRMTDRYWDPPERELNRELPVPLGYLPSRSAFAPDLAFNSIGPPPCIKNGYVTFGTFSGASKINQGIINCWAAILNAVPGSRMMIGHIRSEQFVRTVVAKFGHGGVESHRLEFLPALPIDRYMDAHRKMDILLDTYPYNGGTTNCFALRLGLPIVTMTGDYGVSRQGFALLSHLGIPQFAAPNEKEYIKCAVELASDSQTLEMLRKELPERFVNSAAGQPKLVIGALEKFVSDWIKK